jgi:transcriptional regulator with XRE-family HTH domain
VSSHADRVGRPRLRELRLAAKWSQAELAERLRQLAWALGYEEEFGVNAHMISKWERGEKGISARYRILLCRLFGVTPEQIGFLTTRSAVDAGTDPETAESLVAILDRATAIVDLLGPKIPASGGSRSDRERIDGLFTGAIRHARTTTATPDELEHLTRRYEELYVTADPAALTHSVVAHVRSLTAVLRTDQPTANRRRILRCLASAATLAGRLAYEDLGDPLTGRAYLSTAVDAAVDAGDLAAAVTAEGHQALLAQMDNRPSAALAYLAAAREHVVHAHDLAAWLESVAATIHADQDDQPAAEAAIKRAASSSNCAPHSRTAQPAQLAAAGRIAMRTGSADDAREHLEAALDAIPASDRRTRALIELDLATNEIQADNPREAFRHAIAAMQYIGETGYAAGRIRLAEFRRRAQSRLHPRLIRTIDACLSRAPAA